MAELGDLLTSFIMLFVVLDPVGAAPYVASLTSRLSKEERVRVVTWAVVSAGLLLLGFTFIGTLLFEVLGIEPGEFKVAAGLMLLVYAAADLFEVPIGFRSGGGDEASLAIFPIATPLLAGPGSVATVLYIKDSFGPLVAVASVAVNLAVAYPILLASSLIVALLGRHGALLIGKFMSLIMVAFAVSIIREGLIEVGMV